MANDKKFVVKNGLRTQNITFEDSVGGTHNINIEMYDTDTLSFEGNSGQLFSITDDMSGTIFSVNDISGTPSIEVDADGTVRIAEISGNVLIGTATDDGTNILQVDGTIADATGNSTNWNTAYGWGDHSTAGYQSASSALTTSTTFGGDVSGTYNAIVIADDSHNHVISNVDGLQTALDAKQNSATALTTSTTFGGDVSGTYNAIVIADDSHNHVISNVDGLQTALDGKLSLTGGTLTGSLKVNTAMTLNSEEATLATTTQTQIANFSATTYGGGKFVITAKDGVNRHICELLVTHDGTTAVATQYGSVTTASDLATYDVDISGGNVRILATSASTNSTVYKVADTLMEA